MAELKIICKQPDSLKRVIEEVLAERLRALEDGIRRTEERIQEFETKYRKSFSNGTSWESRGGFYPYRLRETKH